MDKNLPGSVVAIGKFDGIHTGHTKLLREGERVFQRECFEKGKELNYIVFTFGMIDGQQYIYNDSIKQKLIGRLGVDKIITYPFDDSIRLMKPDIFIKEILIYKFNAKYIVVGDDFRFGYERSGDADTLKKYSEQYGYEVIVVERECYKGSVVSSSRIKNEILSANIPDANAMLGRELEFSGEVVYGNRLGRKLGMPTVNIIPDTCRVLPPNGVYSSLTQYNGKTYQSVTNIGIKPTIDDKKKLVIETHMFDFDEEIYGKEVSVRLLSFLRHERKFDGLGSLKEQMMSDREEARKHHHKDSI